MLPPPHRRGKLTREPFRPSTAPHPPPLPPHASPAPPTPAIPPPVPASRCANALSLQRLRSFNVQLQLLSPAPSPMKPLPSPSRAALAATSSTFGSSTFSSSTFGSRPEQDYIAAAYSGHMHPPQTSTFSSVRSSPSASFQSQHVAHQHQRNAGMQQQLDDILQNDYMQISHEHRRPATPPALSSAEADSLRLELQASSAIRWLPPSSLVSFPHAATNCQSCAAAATGAWCPKPASQLLIHSSSAG